MVAIERAEGLLVEFLHLLPGVTVFCASRRYGRGSGMVSALGAKSDVFDAFVLADTLRHEGSRWRPLSRTYALTAELQAVSRDRQREAA